MSMITITKIYIGSDHAGYELKEKLKKYIGDDLKLEVIDKGAFSLNEDDDYPDFIVPVSKEVSQNENDMGIILGGSGQGEAISANKIKGIRAVVYYGGNFKIVELSREHNNANILSLGARFIKEDEAKEAVKIFIETPFSNEERHIRRINKIESEI